MNPDTLTTATLPDGHYALDYKVRRLVALIVALTTAYRYDDLMDASDSTLMGYYDRTFGGRKIQAIKHLRAVTSMGLREAKDFIETEVIPNTESSKRERLERLRETVVSAVHNGVHPRVETLEAYARALRERP